MNTRQAGLFCSLTWLLCACGSAASYNYDLPPAGNDQQPTLATMRGQTAGEPVGADPALLRVALVWFPISPASWKRQFSQYAKHQQLGWGSFEVNISQEPPPPAIEGTDMMRYAQAEIVLYEDRNDNRAFDIVDPAAKPIDRVVGRAQGVRVWWLSEGSPAPTEQRGFKPVQLGWSFTYGPIKSAPDARDCEPSHEPGDTWKPVCRSSIKEPAKDVTEQTDGFILTVSNDPKLQSYACRGFWGTNSEEKSDEWSDKTRDWNSPEVRAKICNPETCDSDGSTGGPLDLPVSGRNVKIECNPNKLTYRWRDCEPDPKLCGTVFCHEGKGVRDPDLTKPAPNGWPQECL